MCWTPISQKLTNKIPSPSPILPKNLQQIVAENTTQHWLIASKAYHSACPLLNEAPSTNSLQGRSGGSFIISGAIIFLGNVSEEVC